jgi:alpha-L-arabinofuranosidase
MNFRLKILVLLLLFFGNTTCHVLFPSPMHQTLVGTQHGICRVPFDDAYLKSSPSSPHEHVRIFSEHTSERPISVMQQGQFIEILCNLIPSIIAQQVTNTSFEEMPPCKVTYKKQVDQCYRPWYPDGAVEVATYSFDTKDPFNGAHSQKIELPVPRARAGISQDGFYLRQGVVYKLHLHMRSEGHVHVWASLHGSGHMVAGPVFLGRATETWHIAEGELQATRTINNTTLTIDFEGPGTLWLDRVYLIGSDAVLGIWRPDVVAALKRMHPGIVRFGGSTIEDYEWERGIGPWDQRQPFTTVWGGLEENFVGIDEFVQLCNHISAEPLICMRWAGKKPEDAAAEVEYCNGSVETPWGKLRAQNGHPEPYHVKYWQIGNEVDSPAYNDTVAAFAHAMKKADPSIKLISSFPTASLLEKAGVIFDYLAPHHYEIRNLAAEDRDFRRLEGWIIQHQDNKRIGIAVTEWNTTAGDFGLKRGMLQTLGNALSVAHYLNLLQRHADFVEIANRSNLADSFGSGFLITGPGWIYESPAYYTQQLYARAGGSYPLRIERSSRYAWQFQEPDLAASFSPRERTLRIYGVNSTNAGLTIHFELDGFPSPASGGTIYTIGDRQHAGTSEVMNSRDAPKRISLSSRPAELKGTRFDFVFSPLSITLLELKVAE